MDEPEDEAGLLVVGNGFKKVRGGRNRIFNPGADRASFLGLSSGDLGDYCIFVPDEPIQPIDPAAWVSHSAALTGTFPAYPGSSSMSTITSGSSLPDGESRAPPHLPLSGPFFSSRLSPLSGCESRGLSIHMDMASVTKAMAAPESGLEVRDRMWLKITIPNAFLGIARPWARWRGKGRRRPRLGQRKAEGRSLEESLTFLPRLLSGSDVVDWLYHHVEGFPERREARKYASGLLKAGLIRHTVNKITFSEQCYYVFGDLSGGCESCKSPALVWENRLSYLVLLSSPRPGPETAARATRVVRSHTWPRGGQPWGLMRAVCC